MPVTRLWVVLDGMLDLGGRDHDYESELTRALVETAPSEMELASILPAITEEQRTRIRREIPQLTDLAQSALDRRQLRELWRRGLATGTDRWVHALGTLAPLSARSVRRPGQVTVTVSDPIHDQATAVGRFTQAMVARAARYADAIVVPNHGVAESLDARYRLGDRLVVIPAAPRSLDARPDTDDTEASIAVLTDDDADFERVAQLAPPGASARVVTASTPAREIAASSALVVLTHRLGFALPVLDAYRSSVPVISALEPGSSELLDGAALSASSDDEIRGQLEAIADHQLRDRVTLAGVDRVAAYSWRSSAELIWHLHAMV